MKIHVVTISLCLFSGLAMAQGLGELAGTVSDPSGGAIPGAKVTITETGTGYARSTITSQDGLYAVPSLRPSSYNLAVEAPGFRSFSQTGITLGADQKATVNVKLELGVTSETISVVGE